MQEQKPAQTLQKSTLDPLTDPKNSKILNRKQIQKRLQGLKAHEYEKISSNLEHQNNRLKKQVKELRDKVDDLLISRKMPKAQPNSMLEEEIKNAKKQLELKYEKMNYLKEQIKRNSVDELDEGVKNRIRSHNNEIYSLNQEINSLAKQKQKQNTMLSQHNQWIEEYHPRDGNRDERIQNLKQQNQQLKKKFFKLSLEVKAHDKNSQETIDKLYTLKTQQQKYLQALMESKTHRKKSSAIELKVDEKEIAFMQRQVEELKRQKKDAEKQLVNEKIVKDQKKAKLEKQARQGLEYHKDLLRRRMKLLNQLNLYEAKDRQHKQLQDENAQKEAVMLEDRGVQTDKIIPKDFRKEWIGKSQGFPFDDAQFIENRSQISIKSVIIYKTSQHIVFVKFFYESALKKRYESKVPLQSTILRKYESRKHTARVGCFLKNFKVSMANDKITRIELIWSDGDTSVEGTQTDGCVRYVGDIGADEKPVCMFGSVAYHGKNNYALESLGCQINFIQND